MTADSLNHKELCGISLSDKDADAIESENHKSAHNSIVELKEVPSHLKYMFLEKERIHPVIVSSALDSKQEESLLTILRLYKNVIGYSMDGIRGINENVCSHRIHLEEGSKTIREGKIRLNPAMQEVVKKEILKLLKAEMVYPISESEWVSPIHIVPKKGGYTVVENEEGRLMTTRPVTCWRVFNDFRKLNKATRKDHFPLPFIDQMLERLAGHKFYCYIDGYYVFLQIDPFIQMTKRRLHSHVHMEHLLIRDYHLGYAMLLVLFRYV